MPKKNKFLFTKHLEQSISNDIYLLHIQRKLDIIFVIGNNHFSYAKKTSYLQTQHDLWSSYFMIKTAMYLTSTVNV